MKKMRNFIETFAIVGYLILNIIVLSIFYYKVLCQEGILTQVFIS